MRTCTARGEIPNTSFKKSKEGVSPSSIKFSQSSSLKAPPFMALYKEAFEVQQISMVISYLYF
jgi:hypothetical protein